LRTLEQPVNAQITHRPRPWDFRLEVSSGLSEDGRALFAALRIVIE
jgi:hypothetical protein